MTDMTTARERLEKELEMWGLNKTIPVRSEDLRDWLLDSSDAYVNGWNACCDAFNVGAHIARERDERKTD